MTQDPGQVKAQMRDEWGAAADGWRKYDERLRALGKPVAERMLSAAQLAPGKRVLDVACGTGEPAIPAARMVSPGGSVLATDLAEEMLVVARDKAKALGVDNIEFRLADGEALPVEDGSFDAVTCRWGIMFMPRPEAFVREVHRALKDRGRIALAVWGPPQQNTSISLPLKVISRHTDVPQPPPGAPGVFAFADKARLTGVLSDAGFKDVTAEEVPVVMSDFASGREYWSYVSDFSGPVKRLLAPLSDDVKKRIGEEVATEAGGGDPEGRVYLTGVSVVSSGTK